MPVGPIIDPPRAQVIGSAARVGNLRRRGARGGARAHPTSVDILRRRGGRDVGEIINVRRRIIIIIISRRVGPGAAEGDFGDRAILAAHRHVGHARP
jgi:hypothetical protein